MRIAFLNWRDSTHPEGGGAEHYAEQVCAGLAALGHDVTLYCARHRGSAHRESTRGFRIVRQGSRLTVYADSLLAMRADESRDGRFDVVVDTQNGLPFFSPLRRRTPIIALVHHVHREQWPVVFNPAVAKVGWWVESQVSPRLYRGRPYVAVSERTRTELVELGVRGEDVTVIHNGTDLPLALSAPRASTPTVVVLGRLVPHKRVEQAVDVVQRLRARHPGIRLRIVGTGWWHDRIAEHARAIGAGDIVDLLGFVSEEVKHSELASAWVALAPSIKEGWGLNVVEAASHGVPTIAYHGAGGLSESIVDGETGLLVDDLEGMVAATDRLLTDRDERDRLGAAAVAHAQQFTWEATVAAWDALLRRVAHVKAPTPRAGAFT